MDNKEWTELAIEHLESDAMMIKDRFEDSISMENSILIAALLRIQIVLEQGLHAGYTKVPNPLEQIAISLKERHK